MKKSQIQIIFYSNVEVRRIIAFFPKMRLERKKFGNHCPIDMKSRLVGFSKQAKNRVSDWSF